MCQQHHAPVVFAQSPASYTDGMCHLAHPERDEGQGGSCQDCGCCVRSLSVDCWCESEGGEEMPWTEECAWHPSWSYWVV